MILACCIDGGLFDALILGAIGGPTLMAWMRRSVGR